MKKYVGIYVTLAAAIICSFFLYTHLIGIPTEQAVDIIAINDIVQTVQRDWTEPNRLEEAAFAYPVTVIDMEGNVVWTTGQGSAQNMQEALRQRYAVQDIVVENQVVGRALIRTTAEDTGVDARKQLAAGAFVAVVLLGVISLVFLALLHRAIIAPFQRLEAFAHKISTGSLQEPLPMDKNNTFGLFTQSFDIMRTSLLDARERQRELEQAKKELVVSLGHDIKTPVTSMKLIAELLQATSAEPTTIEKLKTIEDKANQITWLVNDMMHSALEELGELQVSPSTQTSETLQTLLDGADYRGLVRAGQVPACMVEMDTARMEQVLGNVIVNSYKYANTPIEVNFALEGAFLCMDVQDFGPGVEHDALELICNKYYRGEAARASEQEGEGLGLYVSKLLMEKMGGGLEAHNWQEGFCVKLLVRLS